jgi:hypothetical protein
VVDAVADEDRAREQARGLGDEQGRRERDARTVGTQHLEQPPQDARGVVPAHLLLDDGRPPPLT